MAPIKKHSDKWICEDCIHRETDEYGDDPVYNYSCKYNIDNYPFVVSCSQKT